MKQIDLRSDTVTLPSPQMREAIADAQLGDDVFGEDPTTNRLQETAAEMMGKEAALLVSSGTMANLVAILTHCGRGEEVILGKEAHTFVYEAGGMSALGSIHSSQLPNRPDGTIALTDVEAAIRPDDQHFPRTRLICLENTHNRCSGAPLSVEYTKSVAALAKLHNLKTHVDGARIFNATIALGVQVRELAGPVDSVSFCLSKGLAAPVGSLICGPADFIAEARRIRKSLGGGMRQSGIIAAAGIVALEQMVDRLAEDHENARRLAEGIAEIDSLAVNLATVKTNIVYFELADRRIEPSTLVSTLEGKGVRILAIGNRFRAVTHYGIESADIDAALSAMQQALAGR